MTTLKIETIAGVADLKSGYTLGNADVLILKAMSDELLAVREAQPVGVIRHVEIGGGKTGCHATLFNPLPAGTELFTAPPAPALPGELLDAMAEVIRISDRDHEAWTRAKTAISACHAAMLVNDVTGGEPVTSNSPVIPDGWKLVPAALTAENGAKASLVGEFTEVKYISCPECFGDDECESCDGSGRIKVEVPVTWTTIKAIWIKGIEHFDSLAAAPTPAKAGDDE